MVAPKWAVDMLADSGVDSPEFDASQLYMAAGGDDKNFAKMVQRRAKREPLQYILGEWDFFDMTLQVGPGVLCPRGDTEFVTDQALQRGPFTKVLDLCSGSGCIALAIARFCKTSSKVSTNFVIAETVIVGKVPQYYTNVENSKDVAEDIENYGYDYS